MKASQLGYNEDLLSRNLAILHRKPNLPLDCPPAIGQGSINVTVPNFQRMKNRIPHRSFRVGFWIYLKSAQSA